jgi:hypothetical protein
VSLHAVPLTQRFTLATLAVPQQVPLRTLDIDIAGGVSMSEWRNSGLGPCVTVLAEAGVLGEFPTDEQVCDAPLTITAFQATAL